MIQLIFIITLFTGSFENSAPVFSKIDILTGGNQKAWSILSSDGCSSSSDDQWIFFFNGTFEFNHGTTIEDQANECSDPVNFIGTWEFTNNESGLRIKAINEKGNPSNVLNLTVVDAPIMLLDDDQLKLSQTDPSTGSVFAIEFRKK